MKGTREPEIVEQEVSPTLPMKGGGTVDIQVSTARQYPRSITSFIQRATEMATLTPEIAASCIYALPRDGKTIEGPSARLAEIVANAWGNLRIQAGATENDDRYITARGEAWDVEANTAIAFEVRRRITNRSGATFNDDMIGVTGNAAASIALRNAVFKAVPSPFWRPIYLKCRQVIAGDARTFSSRRDEQLKAFAVMGVTEQQICALLKVKGKLDVTLEHMTTLVGVFNSIRDGETTIEEAFPDAVGAHLPKAAQRTTPAAPPEANGGDQGSQQRPAVDTSSAEARSREMPSAETGAVGGATPPPTTPAENKPAHIGRIADIKENGQGAAFIILDTGFVAGTNVAALITDAKEARAAGVIVELVTRPPSDPKFKPTLLEVKERIDLMEGQS
jgi:hypothetical protein